MGRSGEVDVSLDRLGFTSRFVSWGRVGWFMKQGAGISDRKRTIVSFIRG